MTVAYEAARAFALDGDGAAGPPVGFGVLLRSGVPAWLATWVPAATPVAAAPLPMIELPITVAGVQTELVVGRGLVTAHVK